MTRPPLRGVLFVTIVDVTLSLCYSPISLFSLSLSLPLVIPFHRCLPSASLLDLTAICNRRRSN